MWWYVCYDCFLCVVVYDVCVVFCYEYVECDELVVVIGCQCCGCEVVGVDQCEFVCQYVVG